MKFYKIIIFVLIILAFLAGIYFKDNAIRFYNNLNKQVQGLKKADVGQIISEVQKKVLEPGPLNIGGVEKNVVLLKSKIIAETNLQRKENGNLPQLAENAKLAATASAKANDMFLNQYFEHVSPNGTTPGELAQNYGYNYIIAGENLILGNFASEKEVVQNWMDSPGHRANILNNRYTEIGVAIIKGTYKGETVWIGVQEFGLSLSSCNEPSPVLKNQIDAEKNQIDILFLQINESKTTIENTNQNSAVYRKMIDDYNQIVLKYNSLADQLKQDIANFNEQVNIFNACVNGK